MHRVGLALSGGGFRATLYHLGVVRFLRDAQVLPKITHITCVSGGSILGAHLALNWERYCGSESDFDQAAGEILKFIQMDVRNRIVRRFPLASTLNLLRKLLRLGPSRKLTRPGLLESYYERFLYGDIPLSELPSRPQLHILATNLSEGCLCSFSAGGLIIQRRTAGKRDQFERVSVGLGTVPMAVAASSAFPGFFPPLELSGWDVGSEEGEFDRHAFTDGGVYDNLGLRMFRCIEQSWVRDITPLGKEDFLELEDAVAALISAESLPENTPLHRIRKLLDSYDAQYAQSASSSNQTDRVIRGLWDVMRSEELYRDPQLQGLELADPDAESLLRHLRTSDRELDTSDRLWLNRQMVGASLRQVVGKPCLRAGRVGFDAILVSDAGGKFKVSSDGRATGLIKTVLRSSDILWDRVWQLELEAFASTPGILFFPMNEIIDSTLDRWALHPEVQRQTTRIRTDLDRFSDLEISSLVRHGYCVARKFCQSADLVDGEQVSGPPWDPFEGTSGLGEPGGNAPVAGQSLRIARKLRYSSRRRIWSTLFSWRDWPTYVWIPLFVVLFCSLPYWIFKLTKHSRQQRIVLTAMAATSPEYRKILELLEEGPVTSFQAAEFKDVESLDPPDTSSFEIVSDTRIVDLRRWTGEAESSRVAFVHQRVRVRRKEDSEDSHLRFQFKSIGEQPRLSCKTKVLKPKFSRLQQPDGRYLWELDLDFSVVPIGGDTEVVLEAEAEEIAFDVVGGGGFAFSVPTETGLVQIWMLMPESRHYHSLELVNYPIGEPEKVQVVVPDTTVELPLGSLATFRFINPESNHRYECRWRWETPTLE